MSIRTAGEAARLLIRRSLSVALIIYLPTELFVLDALRPHANLIDALGILGIGAIGVTALAIVVCTSLAGCYCVAHHALISDRARSPIAASVRFVDWIAISAALVLAARAAKNYMQVILDTSWALGPVVQGVLLLGAVALATYLVWGRSARGWSDRFLQSLDSFAAFCLAVLAAATVASWVRAQGPERVLSPARHLGRSPDVVLLTIDAFSASRSSLYGYARPTTPRLAEFGASGMVFDSAVANANFTTAGFATIMSGRYVTRTGAYQHAGPPVPSSMDESLPRLLKARGYQTAAFVANPFAHPAHLALRHEFDVAPPPILRSLEQVAYLPAQVDTPMDTTYLWYVLLSPFMEWLRDLGPWTVTTPYPPELLFRAVLDFLASRNDPRPLFLWVHVMPPHDPYLPPEPFRGKFRSSDEMTRSADQARVPNSYGPRDSDDVAALADRYDEFLAYTDDVVGNFLDRLERDWSLDRAIVIVSSDHGESFSHGVLRHGGPELYESLVHIPLIVRTPWGIKGRTKQVVEQVDLLPTIAELTGAPPPARSDGRSIAPLLRGERLDADPSFSIAMPQGSRFQAPHSGVFAVRDGNLKLIWRRPSEQLELYDVVADPSERYDLAASHPDQALRLKRLIRQRVIDRALPRAAGEEEYAK